MRTRYAFSDDNIHGYPLLVGQMGIAARQDEAVSSRSVSVLIEAVDWQAISAIRALLPCEARVRIITDNALAERSAGVSAETASPLSSRQCEILELLVQGHSNKAIGRRLAISHFTVRNHLAQLMRGLKVATRRELAEKCLAGAVPGFQGSGAVAFGDALVRIHELKPPSGPSASS